MAAQESVAIPSPSFFDDTGMLSRPPRGLWTDAARRMMKNKLAVVSAVLLFVVIVLAFAAPQISVLERHEPAHVTTDKQLGPTGKHWFGTDQLGRDVWARTLEGVRVSVKVGVGTQVVVLALGITFGVLAALGGRWTDNLVMRFADIMFSFPDLLFIIILREILIGRDVPGITNTTVLMLAIGGIAWTTVTRLVRGQMLSLAERDFVIAAQALGASRMRIITQHMLPNTLGPVIVAITFGIPAAIFIEASLSFIGLGLPAPAVSLGTLVSQGYATLQKNTWNVVFPAGAIAMLMLCFTFLGDGLRDALDPRTR
jgi:oligopeptide transport system permease protein